MNLTRTRNGASIDWELLAPEAKLTWRASLPGARTYDESAHVLRCLQASGSNAIDLLPLAFPSSWLVNAKASSRAFRRWSAAPARAAWTTLFDALPRSPEEWLELPESRRTEVSGAATVLADGVEGASLAAVTKVLALVRPEVVCLMDDAALWFALENPAVCPVNADSPTAPSSLFVPMLDWFAESVVREAETLDALAESHSEVILDGSQALDRLLWVESWGHRLAKAGTFPVGA